jgi:transcriptional regulator with XRE-family HTH domain
MADLQLGAIGARIAQYRKKRGMRQNVLAERVGLHPVTLSKIEHGQLSGLTLAVLWRIAVALRVPVAYLWEQVVDRPAYPWEQAEDTTAVPA